MEHAGDISGATNAEPDGERKLVQRDRWSSTDPGSAGGPELRPEAVTSPEIETGRATLEGLWEAQERIATLEEMLTKAREREQELTTEAVRHRARIFEADARIFELSSIAARVTAAEDARRDAEALAQENERAAAQAKSEAKAAETEITLVRARNAELESDLASIADELAAATMARTEAVRQEREENEARQRAQVERRMAAEGRLRASEATLRANDPRDRPSDAETRMPATAGEDGGGWKPSAPVEGVADETPSTALSADRSGPDETQQPADEREAVPVPSVGADAPSVVIVGEASSAEETAAAEVSEDTGPPSVSTESPRPLWSASKQAASVATTADPWGTSESATPAVTMPSPSRPDAGEKEPEVIDLTVEGSAEADPSSEEKPAFEERVNLDASARWTGGWSDTWGLIRGRRKD